jgi:cullin 3
MLTVPRLIRVVLQQGVLGHSDGSDFDAIWEILRDALSKIHTRNASKLSFEQLYRAAYKLILKKKGNLLYDKVKEFEEQWFASQVMPKIQTLITRNLTSITLGAGPGATVNERRLTGEKFLKGLKASWEDHNTCMSMTADILMYMDRVYCSENKIPSIFTTAMGLFRDHVLRSALVAEDSNIVTVEILNAVILDQIQMEREGDVIDKNLVKTCLNMLEGLYETDAENEDQKLYLTEFEPVFLQASKEFYQKECMTLLQESDCSTWLRQTQKRINEEADRCRTTTSLLTDAKIAKIVENEMIASHLQEFIGLEGSGVEAMINNDRFDDLALLYAAIARIDPKLEALRDALSSRILAMGSEINKTIQNTDFAQLAAAATAGEDGQSSKKAAPMNAAAQATAAAIKWVDDVLLLKDKFDLMWKDCFNEDLILQTALTKSFSDFINLFHRSSEFVSLFIDSNLKTGIKGRTEEEVDKVLDKATTLLRYISDKDMFERYYKKHLARRLLHGKSESTDIEKQMISRMKQEVGNYFTAKLEGMFKDMTMSEELTSGYRTHITNLGSADKGRIDLGVNVLTSNFWPMEVMNATSRDEDGFTARCNWPPEIKTLQESFTKYYLKERNGRKLSWLPFTGSADIRCTFPKVPGKEGLLGRERRHELTVPTYGMMVLLLFNDVDKDASLTFEEIQEATLIPPAELIRILTTLAVIPKAKVLNKDPPTKNVKAGDRFSFNASFTSKSVRIKAPTITGINKVEGDEERKETESKNDEMRAGVIEACIVRIMKYVFLSQCPSYWPFTNIPIRQRKELAHQQLFAEVIAQLSARFKPDLNMVKKRVESLIEREYLERAEDADRPSYRYLA